MFFGSDLSMILDGNCSRNNLFIFALVIIGLMVIFLYGIGDASAVSGDIIYVNGSSGFDGWDGQYFSHQPGTIHGPKLSIKNAIGTVNNNGTVNIADAKYVGINNTQINIYKNLNIRGQSKSGTVINGSYNSQMFYINSGIKVTMTNLTFVNGEYNYGGSAITNCESNLTITTCTFIGNNANGGGAIENDHGNLTITSSIFTGNNATYGGGAIENDLGNLNVIKCNFDNNYLTSTGGGGGAITNFGTLNVLACTFKGNIANNGEGGAIFNGFNSTMSVTGSTFTGNKANSGGAICNDNGQKYMTSVDSTFIGNNANSSGGAIYNGFSSTISLTRSNFTGNNATYGGVIKNYGIATIHFNRIVGNTSTHISAISNDETADASLNWWGSNAGPSDNVSNTVIVKSWLVLTITSKPSKIQKEGYTVITADLTKDNTGTLHTESYVPNGILVKFKTSLGKLKTSNSSIVNGISKIILNTGFVLGTATVTATIDNIQKETQVKIVDTIPPKISTTTPTNLKTGVSKTSTITIKFTENIKSSTYLNNISIKNLSTNKYLTISESIKGNTIIIKTTSKRTNTWYKVTIPKAAVKDVVGNNLQANYTFKFKTG